MKKESREKKKAIIKLDSEFQKVLQHIQQNHVKRLKISVLSEVPGARNPDDTVPVNSFIVYVSRESNDDKNQEEYLVYLVENENILLHKRINEEKQLNVLKNKAIEFFNEAIKKIME